MDTQQVLFKWKPLKQTYCVTLIVLCRNEHELFVPIFSDMFEVLYLVSFVVFNVSLEYYDHDDRLARALFRINIDSCVC